MTGYGLKYNVWEMAHHLVSTRYADQYEYKRRRRHKEQGLNQGEPGAAVIEYEYGEWEMVRLTREGFWGYKLDLE